MQSGSISKTIRTGYTLRLDWKEQTINESNNTSTVVVEAKLITESGYNIQSSASKDISITVDGVTKSGTCTIGSMGGNNTKLLWSATFTVTHNNDGSKTAAVKCVFGLNVTLSGVYYGTQTVTGSAVLTKISRTPSAPTSFTITAGNGNYVALGDTVTLSWSGASANITGYEVQYSRGSSGWKPFKIVQTTASSVKITDSFTSTDININGAGKSVQYRVRAMNGTLASAWKVSNVLTISGAMDIKVSGSWRTGSVWIKVNGSWRRAKKVWIKQNGTWVQSK